MKKQILLIAALAAVAVSLERTWATAAGTVATADAAFTPGALLYLS